MQFRRSGQRDERRRRFLSDPSLVHDLAAEVRAAWGARAGSPGQWKSQNYGDATFLDEQRRLTDLVPRRLSTFALLFVAGLIVVAGLEALHTWTPQLAETTANGRLAALDLAAEGNLAGWFSSCTLALAALAAVIVYTVRRYKTDDYHGNYRVWLWAAMCWMLMSADEAASLHEGFTQIMVHLTGTTLLGDGSIWWVTAYGFLLVSIGTRLLVDMWRCWLSTVVFGAAAIGYLVAVATHLGWSSPEASTQAVMLEEGAEMVGNLLLLLAMGLHARYVIFDAEGLLPYGGRRLSTLLEDDQDLEAEDSLMSDNSITVHAPHSLRGPVSPPALNDPVRAGIEQAETSVRRKLTKAEKKALRKRLTKQRLERQRRGF